MKMKYTNFLYVCSMSDDDENSINHEFYLQQQP